MTITKLMGVALLPLVAVAGETWYPAADWKDAPDPVASPLARKGGLIRFNGSQAPKSFNYYVDNNTYAKMMFELMYECLIGTDSQTLEFVPMLARRWSVSDDGQVFTFVLDERARWSDGVPVTAEDVKWTFDQVTAPMADTGPWKVMLGVFNSPEIVDRLTVRFRKKGGSPKDWRDLLNCGEFYILPKHAFEGKDFNTLDLLNAPVSGPYQIVRVNEQIETEYARHGRWWRQDWLSCRHICNFDRILMRYYIDNENSFEALKKDSIDVYPVYSARIMRGETHGEKFDRNWIVKRRVHNHEPVGYQGFAMNMRRWPFDDIRVREAMYKLIDRETMNRTLMFGEYFLLKSYYHDLYGEGHSCTNRMILYDFAGAEKLLREAGFAKNAKTGRLEQKGRPFRFTFLSRNGSEEKFLALFNASLIKLGIEMDITRKDFAEWMRDMDEFNFDMTWSSWGASVFRTPEIAWLSSEADRKTSNNTVGFKSKAVDELIAREKSMMNVADRENAYRAIDTLVAREIPYALLWQIDETRLLYWNKFGMPENILSKFGDEDSVFTYWWYDEDRARELENARAHHLCLPAVPLHVDFDEMMRRKYRK